MSWRTCTRAVGLGLGLAISSMVLADPILAMPEENLLAEAIRPGGDPCAFWVNEAVLNYKWAIGILGIAASSPPYKEEARKHAYEFRLSYLPAAPAGAAHRGEIRSRKKVKLPETSAGYQMKKMLIDKSLAGATKDALKLDALTACRRYDPEFVTPEGSRAANPRLRTDASQ